MEFLALCNFLSVSLTLCKLEKESLSGLSCFALLLVFATLLASESWASPGIILSVGALISSVPPASVRALAVPTVWAGVDATARISRTSSEARAKMRAVFGVLICEVKLLFEALLDTRELWGL